MLIEQSWCAPCVLPRLTQVLNPLCKGIGGARTATSGSLPGGGFALSHAFLARRAILEARHALAVCHRRCFPRFIVLRMRTGWRMTFQTGADTFPTNASSDRRRQCTEGHFGQKTHEIKHSRQ